MLVRDNTSSLHNILNKVNSFVKISDDNDEYMENLFVVNKMGIINYENSEFKTIGAGAFAYCSNLSSVNFSNCMVIEAGAFTSCDNLISVSIPKCTAIGSRAFERCWKLISVNFPDCSVIGSGAFSYCMKMTDINFLNCI